MRSVLVIGVLALAAALGAALVWRAPGLPAVPTAAAPEPATPPTAAPEPAAGAADATAKPTPFSLAALFRQDDAEATRAGRRVFYQFSDASGNVHFVEQLDQVPEAYRDRVGRVEMGDRESSRTRTARRAWSKPKRRPFAYAPQPEVVVYTAPWCGWCRRTLAHLDARNVTYVNKDIEASPANRDELIRKTGRTSIPVVDIEGELIRGHDPARIDALVF